MSARTGTFLSATRAALHRPNGFRSRCCVFLGLLSELPLYGKLNFGVLDKFVCRGVFR